MNINNEGSMFNWGGGEDQPDEGFLGNYPKTKVALKVVGYIALEILKASVKK
jgi:hypothetical protein